MTFEEFVKEVKTNILDYLPKDITEKTHDVRINNVRKSQDQIFHGLSILPRQNDGTTISPNIYLEEFYEEYKNEESLPRILKKLAEKYQDAVRNAPNMMDISKLLMDYNWVRTRFQICACDTKKNQERIKDIMHIMQGPLAGLIYVVIDDNPKHFRSTAVTKTLFEKWSVTENQLIRDALEANKRFGVKLTRYTETLFCLTNGIEMNGAGMIFHKDVMDKIHDSVGDYYILPSSVHECMIVPVSSGFSGEALKVIVRDENSEEIHKDNILSDEVMSCRCVIVPAS